MLIDENQKFLNQENTMVSDFIMNSYNFYSEFTGEVGIVGKTNS